MKRIMAFMLALVMVTTCMVSTVFAAEPTPDVSVSFESAAITADSEAIDAANQYALSVFRGGAKCAAKISGTGCVLCTPGYAIL